MARAPSEEPNGLVYQPELLSAEEEERLLDRLGSLRFDPIVLHGRAARRTGRHFGLDYDYLEGSTIDWHRDAPAFETVVGVSLGGSSRLRFQRDKSEKRREKELRYSITFRTLRGEQAA